MDKNINLDNFARIADQCMADVVMSKEVQANIQRACLESEEAKPKRRPLFTKSRVAAVALSAVAACLIGVVGMRAQQNAPAPPSAQFRVAESD